MIEKTGDNKQIVEDNKNGQIITVDVTTDGNNQKQLMPMIEKTEENIQKALNITPEEFQEQPCLKHESYNIHYHHLLL